MVVGMVIAQMDASQHNLLVAGACFTLYVLNDRCDAAATRFAAYGWHDAVCTAVIAAVLHLHLHARTGEDSVAGLLYNYSRRGKGRERRRIVRLRLLFWNCQRSVAPDMLAIERQDRQQLSAGKR